MGIVTLDRLDVAQNAKFKKNWQECLVWKYKLVIIGWTSVEEPNHKLDLTSWHVATKILHELLDTIKRNAINCHLCFL